MVTTIEGIYQNGQIELAEIPQNMMNQTQVLVTFLETGQIDPTKINQLIEKLETIIGIHQGFEELNCGKTRSIQDFAQEMQKEI